MARHRECCLRHSVKFSFKLAVSVVELRYFPPFSKLMTSKSPAMLRLFGRDLFGIFAVHTLCARIIDCHSDIDPLQFAVPISPSRWCH